MTTTGRFELCVDEDTGRRYWFGSEDGWKDATEVGEDGTLTMSAEHFNVGAVLRFSEPNEAEPVHSDLREQLATAHEAIGAALALLNQESYNAARIVLDDALKGSKR